MFIKNIYVSLISNVKYYLNKIIDGTLMLVFKVILTIFNKIGLNHAFIFNKILYNPFSSSPLQ